MQKTQDEDIIVGAARPSETPTSTQAAEMNSKSWVWKFFVRIPCKGEDPITKKIRAHCTMCKDQGIPTGNGLGWKSGQGTGTHTRHMRERHDMTYDRNLGQVIVDGGDGSTQTQLGGFMSGKPGGGVENDDPDADSYIIDEDIVN